MKKPMRKLDTPTAGKCLIEIIDGCRRESSASLRFRAAPNSSPHSLVSGTFLTLMRSRIGRQLRCLMLGDKTILL